MAFTLHNYFKFDLSEVRKHGYKVGVPHATYDYKENTGYSATIVLTFHVDAYTPGKGYMEITGIIYGHQVYATLDMIQVSSNLGTPGGQWYFICGITGQRCRTLYFDGQSLVSRQALGGVLYKSQTYSHKDRRLWKALDPSINCRVINRDWFSKPHSKKYYQGKPTRMMKRFLKVMNQAAESKKSFTHIRDYM